MLHGNHDVIASLWCWFWTIILLAALTFDNWMVNSEGKESMRIPGAKIQDIIQDYFKPSIHFVMLWNVRDFVR